MGRISDPLPVLDYARRAQSKGWPIFRIVYVTAILHLMIVGGLIVVTDLSSSAGLGVLVFASLYMPLPVALETGLPVFSTIHLAGAAANSFAYGAALGLVVAFARRYGGPSTRQRRQVCRWSYILSFVHIFATGVLCCLLDGPAYFHWATPPWMFHLLLPNSLLLQRVGELPPPRLVESALLISLLVCSPCVSLAYGFVVAYPTLRVMRWIRGSAGGVGGCST